MLLIVLVVNVVADWVKITLCALLCQDLVKLLACYVIIWVVLAIPKVLRRLLPEVVK